jgi:hypothetical protein
MPGEPLRHPDHPRPVTRRDFLSQGFITGVGTVVTGGVFSLFANPRAAYAALSPDLELLKQACGIATQGAGKIPFICFDLAGGANIAGSNVLIGQQGGQLDFLSTAGYGKQGLPGDMVPPIVNPATNTNDFVNTDLGLAFHSDSAFLRGIQEKLVQANGFINGAVIPARSDNDTGNNPHNPMYGIWRAGSDGELLTLIGSEASDSGGNSMARPDWLDVTVRPTKVDRSSDVTGLVDTGKLVGLLSQADAVAVMESIQRISDMKLANVDTKVTADAFIKDLVRCGYVKSADLTDRYGDPSTLNPELDTNLVGPNGVFTQGEFDSEGDFRKAAAVMKMVVNGFAGAGTIEMGGFDYHTGDRETGERDDLRAGRCMGACLEYAARVGVPLMLYVFSDGSVFSNGMIDNSVDGRGKGVWTGDQSSTAASFFLVYNPGGQPQLFTGDGIPPERHQQLGYMRADGDVETASTPAANNVNLLAETLVLNYMALHGEQGNFGSIFPNHGLGNAALIDSLTAFNPIVSGTI